ncbi:S8 family serine peptidase [Bacillus sp. CLL-3-40]|nr:S8 family serine peptidase [Bacillus changyiensis]MDA1477157.1 S8 family serine peptidase [Bacillus changyiensis]
MKKALFLISLLLLILSITGCTLERTAEHRKHGKKPNIVSDKKEVSQIDTGAAVSSYHEDHITGKGIKIAVLDTGIDTKNDDLSFEKGINVIGKDQKNVQDDNGHGTKIAGIIGARKKQ